MIMILHPQRLYKDTNSTYFILVCTSVLSVEVKILICSRRIADLIDKTKTPSYKVEKNVEDPNGDTCILRFHAGPPYEVSTKWENVCYQQRLTEDTAQDVAFKIVNREWALAAKRGFKCIFDRDVLQLWFNFKRYRYRR